MKHIAQGQAHRLQELASKSPGGDAWEKKKAGKSLKTELQEHLSAEG